MKETENKFLEFSRHEKLFESGDKVIAAVSGGTDSVAMLDLLASLKQHINLSDIMVAHINHMLRAEESDRDEDFVKRLAEEYGFKCFTKSADIRSLAAKGHGSIQEVARSVRLQFLEECALQNGANRIVTGHNRDDLAETALMWLMRGTGLKGASGIPPKRGLFVRPLLCLTREEILKYSAEKGLLHVEDSSNSKLDYVRNKIRHELLPLMDKEFYSGAKENITRFAELARDDMDLLDNIAIKEVENISYKLMDESGLGVKISDLLEKHPAIYRRILRFMISGVSRTVKDLSSKHIESIIELCKKDTSGQKFVDLPGDVHVIRSYTNLLIKNKKQKEKILSEMNYSLNFPGSTEISELGVTVELALLPGGKAIDRYTFEKKNVTFLNFDKIKLPLSIRLPKIGDSFVPLGSIGKKKLSDFFIDSKIPQDIRWHIPVITDKDNILWIAGLRVSELYRINIQCRNVLMVSVNSLT